MKKTKLLMPILGVATSISAVAIPSLTLTSCGCSPKIQDVLNMWKDSEGKLYVGGFREDASEGKIKAYFGDTLLIPKDVDYITPWAFADSKTLKTTIPDFIKNFKFEDGYECKVIPEGAFYGAPFESVELTSGRTYGIDPKTGKSWNIDDKTWGIRSLGQKSFFETKNLKALKVCGTLKDNYGDDCFGYTDSDGKIKSKVSKLDLFDVRTSDDSEDVLPYSFATKAHIDPVYGEQIAGAEIYLASYNMTDSQKDLNDAGTIIDVQNKYRAMFGLEGISSITQFDDNIGMFKVRRTYLDVSSFENKLVDAKKSDSLVIHNKVNARLNAIVEISPIRLNIVLNNWEGNLPKKTRLYCDAGIGSAKVILNGTVLDTSKYEISGNSINLKFALSKTDNLKFEFLPISNKQTQMIFTSQAE